MLASKKRAAAAEVTPEGIVSELERVASERHQRIGREPRTNSLMSPGSERHKKRQASLLAKKSKQQNESLKEHKNQCECRLVILKMLGFINAMWLDQNITWFMKTIRDNFSRERELLSFVPSEAHRMLLAGGSMISVIDWPYID